MLDDITVDLSARAREGVKIARRVGRTASTQRAAGVEGLEVSNKGMQDFVTLADQQAEQSIRRALRRHFPSDGFMGEEGGGAPTGGGFWVVDPIDGTTNFIRGFRHWGVSMAFVADRKVQVGVIYDAALDKVYWATRGGGAFKDGEPIKASAITDPTRALAILGHSRRTSFDDYLTISRRLYESGIDYRRMGAAAIGLVRVADGIADLYYEAHLNSWDVLAGALIAQEAGARVFLPPLDIVLRDGGMVIAGAPGLAAQYDFLRETSDRALAPI